MHTATAPMIPARRRAHTGFAVGHRTSTGSEKWYPYRTSSSEPVGDPTCTFPRNSRAATRAGQRIIANIGIRIAGRVMVLRRKGEPPGGRHFRSSDRFLMANGAWYFTTREGIDVGPFQTRPDAVKACDRLIELLRTVAHPDEARKTIEDFIRFQLRRD
jgi:Domain of unknown function (DUF6316)